MPAHNYVVKVSVVTEMLAYLDQSHRACLGSVVTHQQTDPLTGQAHVRPSLCWWGWWSWRCPLQWLGQLAGPDWPGMHQWWCRMARQLKCCAEGRSHRSWLVWLGPLETLLGSRLGSACCCLLSQLHLQRQIRSRSITRWSTRLFQENNGG